ncbi:MAG: cupin domain-containing protein [Candidatus Omnitrophica bacterium]|nr:cupin domain-containing protein [Candidatus Omnitrophota bacterium]
MNLQAIQKDWKARGFSFAVWTDPPGQVWENYVHDTDELFLVLEGNVELEMQGKKSCPPRGKEVLIPAKTVHSVRNLSDSTSRWLYGYFGR